MENLYIEVVDGVIMNHPIFESNLIEVYPDIELNDHDKYIPFERIPEPQIGVFQVNEGITYEFDGPNKVKDVWKIRDMTAEEKQAKIDQVRAMQPYPSWIFDETTLIWSAPIPYPGEIPNSNDHTQTITKFYDWDEDTLNWKERSVDFGRV
jgi:hypothetical protein